MRRVKALGAFAVATTGLMLFAASPPSKSVICNKFGSTPVNGGTYIVQNNVWGADTSQCIATKGAGFRVTKAEHSSPVGPPAGYPSIYVGCHYAKCSSGSKLPMLASSPAFRKLETSVRMSYPDDGTWNAAYDLWFDPEPRADGQNKGAEIMIWLEERGGVRPAGSLVDTVAIDGSTWDVWYGNDGWNVVSYVLNSPASFAEFKIDSFYADAVERGFAQRAWYLTSVQVGFELWIGGTGLAVESFSFSVPE